MWRYRFTFLSFIFIFILLIARLFYWQIVKAEELTALGESQYGKIVTVLPQRGEIKTSDNFPIATSKVSYLVYANPKVIPKEEKSRLSLVLSTLLDADRASVSASLAKDLFWVALQSGVAQTKKNELEKLDIQGIGFEQQQERFYPEASMAAHLLGFVGRDDSGKNKGYFGLEGYYERQLRGKETNAFELFDATGRPIIARITNPSGQIDGRSLVLNIDRVVQFMVERKLKAGIEKYQASGGMVGILDPKTGNVLAIATYPSFDPKTYGEFDAVLYKNPFISNTLEPGSTFKPLVMSSALDAQVVKPDTKCSLCASAVAIGEYSIKTWNDKYYKDSTMIDVIKHSDNTGMVFAARALGLDRMYEYLEKFGIGEKTGIDQEGETVPSIRPKDEWYPIDLATAAFGQGISVTPIELLVGFSSIANKGQRMEPHVVSKILVSDGDTIPIEPKVINKPISEQTAAVMTEILVNAVDNGEAKWAKPKGYRIAGKTGTAQIPVAGHYDPNKTIASFIGFAPANDPKFAMLVIVDRPTTSVYGSETAAPLFFDIAKDLFSYWKIPPTN